MLRKSRCVKIFLHTMRALGRLGASFDILGIQHNIQPCSNNNEKIVLSCHVVIVMVTGYLFGNFGFLEIWVAHEFGSV